MTENRQNNIEAFKAANAERTPGVMVCFYAAGIILPLLAVLVLLFPQGQAMQTAPSGTEKMLRTTMNRSVDAETACHFQSGLELRQIMRGNGNLLKLSGGNQRGGYDSALISRTVILTGLPDTGHRPDRTQCNVFRLLKLGWILPVRAGPEGGRIQFA